MLDLTVMGAYEVAENGDFANWKTQGRRGGGIGGAMDLAVGAKRVFIAMQHTLRDGTPRVLKRCTLPVTARGVVKLLVTDLGLFEVTETGLLMREIAPGYHPGGGPGRNRCHPGGFRKPEGDGGLGQCPLPLLQ